MQQPSLLIWKAFVNEHLCVGCGKCAGVCWTGAIRIDNKKAVVDLNRCICCTICMRTCPREGDLDAMKAQLKGIGTQLEEMERRIEKL